VVVDMIFFPPRPPRGRAGARVLGGGGGGVKAAAAYHLHVPIV